MPKKKNMETQEEQSKRFIKDAQKIVDDGELSPTEAEEKFERALSKLLPLETE